MAQQIMIWVTDELAQHLPITKEFQPVQVWDNENRTFKDEQAKDEDGTPLYESEALLQTGFRAEITPVRLRMASKNPPTARPNPQALISMLGVATEAQDPKPAFGRPQRHDG